MKYLICFIPVLVLSACSTLPFIDKTKSPESIQPESSVSLLLRFERKISEAIIAQLRDQPQPLIYTQQHWRDQRTYLSGILRQVRGLNSALLAPDKLMQLQQLHHYQDAIDTELKYWDHTVQSLQLIHLIPTRQFDPVNDTSLSEMFETYTYPQEALRDLSQILETPKKQPATYSPVEQTRLTLSASMLEPLTDTSQNPIIEQYKEWLLYSDLSTPDQIQKLKQTQTDFELKSVPVLQSIRQTIRDNIQESETLNGGISQASAPRPPTSGKRFSNPKILSDQLTLRLNQISLQLSELIDRLRGTDQKDLTLRDQYQNLHPNLLDSNLSDSNQEARLDQYNLSQLSVFAESIAPKMRAYFPAIPDQPLLVTGHTTNLGPLHEYQQGFASFDLTQLRMLPTIELELLSYQYLLPGHHMVSAYQPLIPTRLFQVAAFQTGWSMYAMDVLASEDLFEQPTTQLAYLVRSKLNICRAIVDIKINSGTWSLETARAFLNSQTPYPEAYLEKQLEWIIQRPGLASEALLVSFELAALSKIAQDQQSMIQWHKMVLAEGPASLDYLKNEFRRKLRAISVKHK